VNVSEQENHIKGEPCKQNNYKHINKVNDIGLNPVDNVANIFNRY